MSFEYWNKLADQVIVISSLLGGFSIAVIANFLVSDTNTRLSRSILKAAVLAASFFLVSVFSLTKVLMMTTKGFPIKMKDGDLDIPSLIGSASLFFGIISLFSIIALSGWTKSKKLGWFTSIIGFVSLVVILYMLT